VRGDVAEPDELERVIDRDVASRDRKQLARARALIADRLETQERVLGAAAGVWFAGKRCLLVATSRRVLASDGERLDTLPYRGMLTVEYNEGWRKGTLMIRVQGAVADVRDIPLDAARALKKVIDTARRSTSDPSMPTPPGA
jgi:hypothetical protein